MFTGTTDSDRKFHLFGLTIIKSETIEDVKWTLETLEEALASIGDTTSLRKYNRVVADGSPAIRAAAEEFFGKDNKILIGMCYFHVLTNVRKNGAKYEKSLDVRKKCRNDISAMSELVFNNEFTIAKRLFLQKWEELSPDLAEYINSQYFEKLNNWHVGALPGFPITNNSLEAFNGVFKTIYTDHQRLNLDPFLKAIQDCIKDHSIQYKDGLRIFQPKPTITPNLFKAADAFKRSKVEKRITVDSQNKVTVVFSNTNESLDKVTDFYYFY